MKRSKAAGAVSRSKAMEAARMPQDAKDRAERPCDGGDFVSACMRAGLVSDRQIAQATGLDPERVARIRRGEVKVPRYLALAASALVAKLSPWPNL